MKDAANIALLVLAIMVAAFTLLYVIRSPWDATGRAASYAAKSIVLALVLAADLRLVMGVARLSRAATIRLVIYTLGAIVTRRYAGALWLRATGRTGADIAKRRSEMRCSR
ncbi:hypothetical protein GS426_05830 [Rhodococcus hoagii]|nr:hypothetical protein [Prescottella equi]